MGMNGSTTILSEQFFQENLTAKKNYILKNQL
jgi:hypothetical protein